MATSTVSQEWLTRARQLKAAGAYRADGAEVAAVHAALYPEADPICSHCPNVLFPAFQAVLRWLRLHDSPTSFASTTVATDAQSQPQARFRSDDTLYRPHGLATTYSNANLTDEVARYILANDPDAERLFATLPAAAPVGESTDSGEGSDSGEASNGEPNAGAELKALKRDELNDLYADEVPDSDPKAFRTKEELIEALLQYRADNPAQQ